tara:strand:- start:1190 stop:1612 length:423 start_codon:yes stop_codon:yes gene_type:complete
MIKLKDLINERFEFRKDDEYQIQGETNSMMAFVNHIKNLPEELGSIDITNSTLSFTTSADKVEFKKKFTSSDKAKVIRIIKDLTIQKKKDKDPIYLWTISSYYGTGHKHPSEDSFYIQFRTKAKDKFGDDMASGKYGPLD